MLNYFINIYKCQTYSIKWAHTILVIKRFYFPNLQVVKIVSMLGEHFVILASFIILLGSTSYFIGVIKGNVLPNRVSAFMWALAPLVAFFAQFKSGIGISSLLTLTIALTMFAIFFASFFNKKSEWKLTLFDLICGLLSFIGLILYLMTNNAVLAILFSIMADGLASLPTLKKSFFYPETENSYLYLANATSAFLTLLTIKNLTFVNSALAIYFLFVCSLLFSLVQFKIGKKLLYIAKFKLNI